VQTDWTSNEWGTWLMKICDDDSEEWFCDDFAVIVSKAGELIDLGVNAGVIDKSGSWHSHGATRIGQGRESARQYLKDNPDVAAKIAAAIRENSGSVAEWLVFFEDFEDIFERKWKTSIPSTSLNGNSSWHFQMVP